MEAVTSRDVLPDLLRGTDTVVQLRHWASDHALVLPAGTPTPITIGSARGCTWRLRDPTGYVSRLHAELVPRGGRWTLHDRGSKNGIQCDGERRRELILEPGVEVELGSLRLVAESPRTIALRGYLRLLLGWHASAAAAVDLALRSVRLAGSRRAALVLRGDDDLVACARELHRLVRGDDAPFLVCDPRRRGMASVRAPASQVSALSAVRLAAGGSVCLIARRLPQDFATAADELLTPESQVVAIVCGTSPATSRLTSTTISIPPLRDREAELERVIDECQDAALADLGITATLAESERAWIRAHYATSIGELAKTTRRLLAMRATNSMTAAAGLLGMSHVSLGEWLARHRPKD